VDISKFREKGQILWLGSKFHGLRKTVGPNDDDDDDIGPPQIQFHPQWPSINPTNVSV